MDTWDYSASGAVSAFLLAVLIDVYGHIQYFLVLSQSLCTDQSSGDATIFKPTCLLAL